jgi:hypothetical protein
MEYSTNQKNDLQHHSYYCNGSKPALVTGSEYWDASQFGYRVVSPLEAQKYTATSCFYDDGLTVEEVSWLQNAGATVEYNPSHIGSSFLPQEDDLYEQEDDTSATNASSIELQQRNLSLAAEVLAAHQEWDDLLDSEASKPPRFECLKEDPYLSDYEEMLPEHVRGLKLVTHSDGFGYHRYYSYDDDFEDELAVAQG